MKNITLEFLFENKNTVILLLVILYIMSLSLVPQFGISFFFITFGLILGIRQIQLGDFDKSWNFISETPPNEMLEVMDEKFNIRRAIPVYRNYISRPTLKNKKLAITFDDCDPYWDGSWFFDLGEDMKSTPASDLPEFGKVTRWRKIKTEK